MEVLPSVNRLRDIEEPSAASLDQENTVQHLQDSWREWFDRITDTKLNIPPVIEEEQEVTSEATEIPIHTVYELPPEELLPNYRVEESTENDVYKERIPKRSKKGKYRVIRISGALLAVVMAVLAAFGTGYFDKYMISGGQVGLLAGVSAYNK